MYVFDCLQSREEVVRKGGKRGQDGNLMGKEDGKRGGTETAIQRGLAHRPPHPYPRNSLSSIPRVTVRPFVPVGPVDTNTNDDSSYLPPRESPWRVHGHHGLNPLPSRDREKGSRKGGKRAFCGRRGFRKGKGGRGVRNVSSIPISLWYLPCTVPNPHCRRPSCSGSPVGG